MEVLKNVTIEEMQELKKEWKQNNNQEKGACLFFNRDIVVARFGTGDNLSKEDFEAGYDDYIYTDIYRIDDDFEIKQYDGGIRLFKSEESDFYQNIESFINAIMELWSIPLGAKVVFLNFIG